MKLYSKLGTIALAAGLALPLVVGAQPSGSMHSPPEGAPFHAPGGPQYRHFLRGLALSEAQRDAIFNIMHEAAPALHQQGKALWKSREELNTLTFSGSVDEPRVKELVDTIARATAEMELLRLRIDQKIFALLTPDQRQQIKEVSSKGIGRR
ncbi:MAG: periplasmic heavy metal sensor [Proteobacteria bacterium]|nr:periplasmic heavy metal sensor [Pseudomonadota bacterium]